MKHAFSFYKFLLRDKLEKRGENINSLKMSLWNFVVLMMVFFCNGGGAGILISNRCAVLFNMLTCSGCFYQLSFCFLMNFNKTNECFLICCYRNNWSTLTCPSGNPCCMEWPSCILQCKKEESSDPLAGIFRMNSTRLTLHPLSSSFKTTWMTLIPRKWVN